MALSAGTRLGPYEILEPLGAKEMTIGLAARPGGWLDLPCQAQTSWGYSPVRF